MTRALPAPQWPLEYPGRAPPGPGERHRAVPAGQPAPGQPVRPVRRAPAPDRAPHGRRDQQPRQRISGHRPAALGAGGRPLIERLYQTTSEKLLSPDDPPAPPAAGSAICSRDRRRGAHASTPPRCTVKGVGANQRRYLDSIQHYDISFGRAAAPARRISPWLVPSSRSRPKAVRGSCWPPGVEAVERLGFSRRHGAKGRSLSRPLYDALYEMLGFEKVWKYSNATSSRSRAGVLRGVPSTIPSLSSTRQNTTPEQ